MKTLELIVLPKPRNKKEFKQTLENLTQELNKHFSTIKIDEFEDGLKLIILATWETENQMRKTLRSEEFLILSGAIRALCEKTVIRIDGKQINNHILELIKI
jgi:hypothetical protein